MNKIKLVLIAVFSMLVGRAYSQDATEWEPQKNITGYISLEGDYFKGLKYFDREYAFSLPEAGILVSYKPIEKLTIKSVFVYRPGYTIDQMLNEANGEYKFADFLNVKAGRFLTPLSPMNTYYYAPVNNSATLPMLIQNHEFFPLNMDGISVNGKIGETFKIDFEAFMGGFRNALWLKTGSLGLFGNENNYFQNIIYQDTLAQSANTLNSTLQFGEGGHIGFSLGDYITIGAGIFNSRESLSSESEDSNGKTTTVKTFAKKFSYGGNIKLKYSTLQLSGEYWKTSVKSTLETAFGPFDLDQKYNGAFAELSNTFAGKITPYARLEYHEVPVFFTNSTKYYRYTGGINYKPTFEVTFKLEYMFYNYSAYTWDMTTFTQNKHKLDLSGLVATLIYKF